MASLVYHKGFRDLMAGSLDYLNQPIKLMLVKSGYVPNKDDTFIDVGGANDPVDHELSVGGYVRQTLTSKTITSSAANDRVEMDAADVPFGSLATGETVAGAVVFHDTGSPTTSTMLAYLDVTDTPTNGGALTVTFAADGFINVNV